MYITRTCKHDEAVVFRHEREDVMLCFVSKSKIITFSLKMAFNELYLFSFNVDFAA